MMAPRFIIDANVGRLATWLRVMGYDATYVRDGDDNELIGTALKEDRVIITRDAGFKDRYLVKTGKLQLVLIKDSNFRSQLHQIVTSLGLEAIPKLSRCIRCNVLLVDLAKDEAEGRVPPYVFQTQSSFMVCSGCDRVYWHGTHWTHMNEELSQLGIEGR